LPRRPLLELQPLDPKRYEGIGLDHLVLYAIDKVSESGQQVSYENIVAAAFRLFPEKFSLIGYNEWPDGKRVHDAIFHCTYKSKQWLSGKKKHGYMFTSRGLLELENAKAWLQTPGSIDKQVASRTRRAEKLATHVESANAHIKYQKGDMEGVTKSDICALLQVTLDTPEEILMNNLRTLEESMKGLGRQDLLEFLSWLDKRIGELFKNWA